MWHLDSCRVSEGRVFVLDLLLSLALLETSRQRQASPEDDLPVPIPNPLPSGQARKDGGNGILLWAWGAVPELGHDFSKVPYLFWSLKLLSP